MKKKRVSTTSGKKTSKRISASGARISAISSSKTAKTPSNKKKLKPPVKASKKAVPKAQTPRSSRITKAISAVKVLSKQALKQKKITVEPLSVALPRVETITDLPFSYNKTEIVLLARDPHWAFTYWDFSAETWGWITSFFERDGDAKARLRIHQLDHGTFYDKDINLEAKNWYLDLGVPNASFEVELGLLDSHGKFHRIALSNRIKTPRNGPSETIDPQWELSEFERRHLYSLAASSRGMAGLSSSVFSSLKRPK